MVVSEATFLQRGTSFKVGSFLSNHMRSYRGLVSNDRNKEDGDIIELDIFEGKVVMICCFSLPVQSSTTNLALAQAVSLVSSELHVFGAFELVIVVNVRCGRLDDDNVAAFNDFVSTFPSFSLLVPYLECDAICESLNFISGSDPTGVLVNRDQRVEWHKPLNFFLDYGADAYPFTLERLAEITAREENYDSWRKRTSVSFFLSSNLLPFPKDSSFIRKNPGGGQGKMRISELEMKSCVGLYLCSTGNLIPALDEVHKTCRDSGINFEIILVYLPFKDFCDPQLFQDRINHVLEKRDISWWVLPFVYWVSRRLWRLCHKDTEDRLIIIDQKTKLLEPHGEALVQHFGIDAYPFSRERLLERELRRLRAITLESLLVYRSQDYVLRTGTDSRHQQEVPVASLLGKNVILYLGSIEHYSDKFYDQLVAHYNHRQTREFDFEVVFVGLNTKSFPDYGSVCSMPWLVCPFDPDHSNMVSKKIFREVGICSTLVAFGKDGMCSARAQQRICSSCQDSPFNDILRNEMITELFDTHQLPKCCF